MIGLTVDHPMHPLGSQSRVLLASVFGPYAQDDQYGSRVINPMELYHNQVTRVQHAFSFRSFFRSWGLMLIQVNLKAPCTLLDFPSQERFIEEIKTRKYDVIGISSIIPNLFKVRRMCRLIRKYQPEATIVVGGHIANVPDLKRWVDADHVVKGDGVRWMRAFLGEDENQPILHPRIISDVLPRIMGVPLHRHPGIDDAVLIPSVGCPMGCNFCSTSAMFGGKGKHLEFYKTGEELFEIMCALESDLRVQEFFVMDENFLLNKKRALQLLDLMETARQAVESESLQFHQGPAAIHDGTTGRVGSCLGVAGPGRQGFPVRKAGRNGYDGAGPLAAVPRDPRARFEHHRPRGAYAGEHRRSHR